MKLSNTLVLLALVGGLIAFVLIWESQQPSTTERLAMQQKPFLFGLEDPDQITVTSKENTLKIVRHEGTWMVETPYQDRAQPDLVAALFAGLTALEWTDTVDKKEQSKEDFRRTGLGTSALEVTLEKGGKDILKCRFGGPAPLEDCFYVSVPSGGKDTSLHVAKTTLPALLAKPPEEWRDDRLVRLKADSIRRFVLSAGSGAIEFGRNPGQPWELIKPFHTLASEERVNSILAALLNLKVRPTSSPEPDPKNAGAPLPPMRIIMEAEGSPQPIELTLHPSTDPASEVQVESSDRAGSFLAQPRLSDFWKLQPNHLRDQHLARISSQDVTALRLRSLALPEVVLDKAGDEWTLTRFGKKEPANQERIQRLIDGLNAAQVREFLTDSVTNLEPYGLDHPFLEVQWTTQGRDVILQFGQGAQGMVSARYTHEPFVFRVNPLMLSTIPPDSLKWRSNRVINANLFSVRRIIVAEGTAPALTLNYNPDDASWGASMAGQDVTGQLERSLANKLLNRVVNFEASDWSSDRSSAVEALKNPTLTVQILVADLSQAGRPLVPLSLTFAPTKPGMKTAVYHGRLNDEPDAFLISRELYEALANPVLRAAGS